MLLLTESKEHDLELSLNNTTEYASDYDKKREDIIAQGNAFLGEDFKRGYLYSLIDLKLLLEMRQQRLFSYGSRGLTAMVPYQQMLVDWVLNKIDTYQYASTDEDLAYNRRYREKFDEFLMEYNSQHKESIVNFEDLFFRA